jgi:hypothetical protein
MEIIDGDMVMINETYEHPVSMIPQRPAIMTPVWTRHRNGLGIILSNAKRQYALSQRVKDFKRPCKRFLNGGDPAYYIPSLSSISMCIHHALQIKGRQSESHLTPLPSQVPWYLFLNCPRVYTGLSKKFASGYPCPLLLSNSIMQFVDTVFVGPRMMY